MNHVESAQQGAGTRRLLPVEFVTSASRVRAVEVRVSGSDVLAFEVGTDVEYVAALAAALRCRAC